MHEHEGKVIADAIVTAGTLIANAIRSLHQHPEPGEHPDPTRVILARIAQLEKNLMSQNQQLLAAVAAVAASIGPLTDKITEVGGEVQQVIDQLNGNNPDVAAAITQLTGIKSSLDGAQTALQSVDDRLDVQLGTGGPGAPTVSSFSPQGGPVGTQVVITGTGFDASTTVSFNGSAPVTVSAASEAGTSAMVNVPDDAQSGPLIVANANGTATSTDNFTVG